MDSEVFPKNLEEASGIKRKVAIEGARLLLIKQKHLGSDHLPEYIEQFSKYLENCGVVLMENSDVKDILSKSLGSSTKINMAYATLNALKSQKTVEEVAKLRGKKVEDLM